MSDYIIATSSTSDLPRTWLEEHNIPFIAYSYTVNDEPREDDCREETRAAVYAGMRRGDKLHTSMINEFVYYDFLKTFLDEGKDVIFLDMSQKMSVSFVNANKAADKMRGNIDASEYKSVVLGLIFLKYISDKFETKYRQLVAEGEGFEEDKDEYTAENIFYVPTEARWERIAAEAHTPEIGQVIDNAMRAIEKENKRLKDILPKNFARPELDKRRLGDVVDLFTNIRMHEHGDSKDILGRAYEYCLSKFAEAEGKLAGEFYTPACIVKTLLMLLP